MKGTGKKMKKLTKAVVAMLMVFAIALAIAPASDAYAKSVKSENKKAKKVLAKQVKNKFCRYGYVDIDKDGITELVVQEYSGKFVDGCDKKKSVSIYKAVNGKAKKIFTDSIDGDFFHPSINCQIFFADTVYVLVNKEHEGYFNQIVYKYNGTGFEEEAYIMEDMSGCGSYRLGGENGLEVEYEEFARPGYDTLIESYADYEIPVEYKNCTTKVANKYLKKMLKAEYKYLCKLGVFDKNVVSPVYSDEDGDGIDEMIVREGPKSGSVLYAYIPEYSNEYFISRSDYTIDENGRVIFD